MNLANDTELANTRAKLALLEERYAELQRGESDDEVLRDVTMRSLKKYINQFKEEIARYQAHQGAQR
jgi:hypothetical protein